MIKRIISLFVTILLIVSSLCVASYAGSDGIAISTKEDLYAVRNDLGGDYYLTGDIVFAPEDFMEGGAFYNGGSGWEPIGSDVANAFTGTFDGKGYSIKGLVIDKYVYNTHIVYSGLFGVNKGTIKNLTMAEGSIAVDSFTLSGHPEIYAGAVVGFNREGTVENCVNLCPVTAITTSQLSHSYSCVGGITGYNCTGSIINCANGGEIYGKSTSMNSFAFSPSYVFAGGVVGCNRTVLENCFNVANVSSATDTVAYLYSGGITGYTWGNISDCFSHGKILAGSRTGSHISAAGGIVGYNDNATITNCYTKANVSAPSTSGVILYGAIAGKSVNGIYNNCYYEEADAAVANSSAKGCKALTAVDMGNAESFAGFDFEKVWSMGSGYPVLRDAGVIGPVVMSARSSRVWGDVNGDGALSELDNDSLYASFVSGEILSGNADINCDGVVNAKDAVILENMF